MGRIGEGTRYIDRGHNMSQTSSQIFTHPSNQLSNDIVTDFEQAMNLVAAECDFEYGAIDGEAADYPKEIQDLPSNLMAFKDTAQRCKTDWFLEMRKAELVLAKKWRESSSEDLRLIGQALETRDYSILAI